MITDPLHALVLGQADLVGTDDDLQSKGWRIAFLSTRDGLSLGSPEQVRRTVESWLRDGVLTETEGYGNRELVYPLVVEGASSDHLAQAEAVLMAEVGRPNLLTWTPPDGEGAPCVFEIFTSELVPAFDDEDELRFEARYNLKLTAYPFVRSEDEVSVTVNAPTSSPSVSTVDDCASASGWTGFYEASNGATGSLTAAATSGVVTVLRAYTAPATWLAYIRISRTGLSSTIGSQTYLRVQMDSSISNASWHGSNGFPAPSPDFSFTLNGVGAAPVLQDGPVFWFDLAALGITSLTSFTAGAYYREAAGAGVLVALKCVDISKSNVLGDQSTTRQLARTLPVAGSVRTPGTIQLSDPASGGLANVMIHTMPNLPGLGQPDLRRKLSSGNSPSADSNRVSGFTSDLSILHTFDIPVTELLPGAHELVALVKHNASATVSLAWAARARQGSTNLSDAQAGTTLVTVTSGTWMLVPVQVLDLPPRKLGTSGNVRIELTGPSGMLLDEAWLFNTEDGHLTRIAANTNKFVWIDSPTPEDPVFRYFLGPNSDRANSYEAGPEISSRGDHELEPPSIRIFTVTDGQAALASSVNLRHYRRFHTRVPLPDVS